MSTTLEEQMIQFAVEYFAYYNTEHMMQNVTSREDAFKSGVIMAYKIINGSGDPEEIKRFHEIMESNKAMQL